MAAKSKLSEAEKTFIVQALACFDSPSVVAKAVKDEFGQDITRQHVETYDPTKKAGAAVAKKWKALFEETRKTFLEDTSSIGISHRAVRLRALQRMAEKAEKQGNMVLAASLHEQAAKEMGDAYTNRRQLEHSGRVDGTTTIDPSKLPTDVMEALLAARRTESDE
ncbi:DUF2280 domain-containing protein [Henriciella mobilis]|uniref:DUF2280 domain-containing protein n=1 Tax=Henriciella mobilis TaxID=2305467 RepID=UPI000E662001|nr:DUF2280 domain-containing protein [Henriciella mobilis]RIJ15966.1 DUF2280 domain-containing protein [Henriciella mobilis]RIJ21176.1 DUF2280 domain-containing protein [Henriciella mobilis]RIJ23123.1 DUF2280 domain-containing protein [Henriciella mobilis]